VENPVLPDPVSVAGKNQKNGDILLKKAKRERELKDSAEREAREQYKQEYEEIPNRVKNNSNECCICYEAVANTAVIPCGHKFFCYPCITNHQEVYSHKGCPFCRGVVEGIVKIYE
jgi:hypothetical protein